VKIYRAKYDAFTRGKRKVKSGLSEYEAERVKTDETLNNVKANASSRVDSRLA
jgi:hypothetical protein